MLNDEETCFHTTAVSNQHIIIMVEKRSEVAPFHERTSRVIGLRFCLVSNRNTRSNSSIERSIEKGRTRLGLEYTSKGALLFK